jgi:hypothetical protein
MSVFSQLLFSLMSRYFVAFSFSSTGHFVFSFQKKSNITEARSIVNSQMLEQHMSIEVCL